MRNLILAAAVMTVASLFVSSLGKAADMVPTDEIVTVTGWGNAFWDALDDAENNAREYKPYKLLSSVEGHKKEHTPPHFVQLTIRPKSHDEIPDLPY